MAVESHGAELAVPRRKRIGGRWRPILTAYLLILPAFAFIAVVFIYSLIRLGYISVHSGNNGDEGPANLTAYRFIVDDPIFRQAVRHNLLLLLSVPFVTVVALGISFVLQEGIRGWKAYRTIVFVPYMLAIPVLGTTFVYVLSLNGAVNTFLGKLGLDALAQDWLGDPSWVLTSIAAIIVYHELGFGVVLFTARLLSLPEEVDQAARIDGCTWWQLRRRVTLPQMRGVITAFVTLELITMLSWVFAYVYSTTRGGPNFASYVLEFYIFDNAFTFRSPTFAAAAAILLLLATTALITIQVRRTNVEVNVE